MDDSITHPQAGLAGLELPGWKTTVSWVCAILMAMVFLTSGLWKITDAPGAAVRMAQARVPQSLSLAAAIGFGIAETFAGVLLLVPRFRRWGAAISVLLLVAFLIFIAVNYNALRGEECSCFPWIKRAVGPGFFIGDTIMLALAVMAGLWAKRAQSLRSAIVILCTVAVFAFVSYGVAAMRQTGTPAPDTVTVNGKPYSLQQGKILIFYFDPECLHCLDAAKRMSQLNWGDTRVVAIPINVPQFAQEFLNDTKLKAVISTDLAPMRKILPFVSVHAGVALVNGREKMALTQFEDNEPANTLRKIGFIK